MSLTDGSVGLQHTSRQLEQGLHGGDRVGVVRALVVAVATDALLTWQTEQLLELETGREGIVVHVRPELVVEIALDGVQRSTRYPGGVALRFARVRRYREDKRPSEADSIDRVRELR